MARSRFRVRNIAIIAGIIVGVGFVFTILFPPQTLDPSIEYINFNEGEFALRINPLAVTGKESFLINCSIRNTINVFDTNGVVRQVVFGESEFSPRTQLAFLIGTTGQPEIGEAVVKTFLSCDSSPLAGSGFKPFLVGGSTITTFQGTDFNRDFKNLKASQRQITQITDMNGKRFFELNSVTVTASDLDRILKDEFDYTTTIKATTTGTLLFRQCLDSNPNCTGTDAESVWEHTIAPSDAFTSFGLIVEGAGFAPLSEQQEIQILTELESGGKLNLVQQDEVILKARLKNYNPQESVPVVNIYWRDNPDSFEASKPFQIRSLGVLTDTEEGGTFHVKKTSFTIPQTNLGQWCFELQEDETGLRVRSEKCLIAFIDEEPKIVDPTDGIGSSVEQGELRIRYEVSTKEKVFQNDITMASGIPIQFDPLEVVGVGGERNVIFGIFIEPQLFFDEEVLKNLRVIDASSSVEYTGVIKTDMGEFTIAPSDLRQEDQTFTKNPVSIKLPPTELSGKEIEDTLFRNDVSKTSTTQGTATIVIGGKIQLEDISTEARWVGVLEGAQFDWNFDYVPPLSDEKLNGETAETCNARGGTIIDGVCVLPDDAEVCFDANNNEVECNTNNDTKPTDNDNVLNDAGNTNTVKCFDNEGNETTCDEDVDSTCDPNTDVNRCGGGQIQGDPERDTSGDIPEEPKLCLGLPFEQCAQQDERNGQTAIGLPPLNLGIGDPLTEYAILIGAGVSVVLMIAIGVRLARR